MNRIARAQCCGSIASHEKNRRRNARKATQSSPGYPLLQHYQDEIVDHTLHDAAQEHNLDTIMEEPPHPGEMCPSGGRIQDSGGNVAATGEAPVLTLGEADKDPKPRKELHFDATPPPIRKDPLQPVAMLTEPPLLVRRSHRNINKPSRFRAMFTKTAAMVILPIVPTRCTVIATHDHMVPEGIPSRKMVDWTYHQVTNTNNPVSRAQEEYV